MFGKGQYSKVILGNVIKTTSGGTPSSKHTEYYDNGDIPWLTSSEVNLGYIYSTEKYITEEGLQNSSAKWVPQNSVVIAMYGATAGKVGMILIPVTTNQAVCTLLPNEKFDKYFLYYAVKQNEDWMLENRSGAAQPNISQTVIQKMPIIMPPMDMQMKFSNIVQQADKSKFEILSILWKWK